MAAQVLFSGFARLYIEGKGVLSPVNWSDANEVTYFIGSPKSRYKIIDHRLEVNQMALDAINNDGINWSPQLFCKPCCAKITKDHEGLKILFNKNSFEDKPDQQIIWMGTMEGEELTANPVAWLQYADIEDGRAAFIGVVDPNLVSL